MEGGRLVDGRRPLVMASLTEVRAAPRALYTIETQHHSHQMVISYNFFVKLYLYCWGGDKKILNVIISFATQDHNIAPSPSLCPVVNNSRNKCFEGSVMTAVGDSAKLVEYQQPTGLSLSTDNPCSNTLGNSRAEQVELEGVVRPWAQSYPAVPLNSMLATSLPPTTTAIPYQQCKVEGKPRCTLHN